VAGTIEVVQFVAIVLTSLSMGVHFGTWLTEAPLRETRSGALFTEVQQGRDRVAARIMPILGNAAILSVAACAFLVRAVPGAFALSLLALVFVAGDMAVTLGGNVPINKKVQSWNVAQPPPEWAELRDRWERLHTIRTTSIVSGFALLVAAVVFFRVP
jgi:ribosomal protein S10